MRHSWKSCASALHLLLKMRHHPPSTRTQIYVYMCIYLYTYHPAVQGLSSLVCFLRLRSAVAARLGQLPVSAATLSFGDQVQGSVSNM